MKADTEHLENLLPETREMLSKSEEERVRYVEAEHFIAYTRANEIITTMERLMRVPRQSRMPCLLIVGDSNNGKTSIIREFRMMHPATDGMDEAAQPVVSILAPIAPDVHAFYDEILNDILIPFKKSDPISKKEMEIRYHFVNLGVKLLIVDEIHNVLSGSVAKQKVFMNALKNLNNKLFLPIVLVGTKDALATSADIQISNNFRPILLPAWELNRDYVSLLASIEKTLPLKKPSVLAKDRELAILILELSEGLIGEIVALAREAAEQAIKTGKERITLEDVKKIGFVKPSLRRASALLGA